MAKLAGKRLILVQIRVWISQKVSGEIKKGPATKNNRTLGHAQKNHDQPKRLWRAQDDYSIKEWAEIRNTH